MKNYVKWAWTRLVKLVDPYQNDDRKSKKHELSRSEAYSLASVNSVVDEETQFKEFIKTTLEEIKSRAKLSNLYKTLLVPDYLSERISDIESRFTELGYSVVNLKKVSKGSIGTDYLFIYWGPKELKDENNISE